MVYSWDVRLPEPRRAPDDGSRLPYCRWSVWHRMTLEDLWWHGLGSESTTRSSVRSWRLNGVFRRLLDCLLGFWWAWCFGVCCKFHEAGDNSRGENLWTRLHIWSEHAWPKQLAWPVNNNEPIVSILRCVSIWPCAYPPLHGIPRNTPARSVPNIFESSPQNSQNRIF